MASSYAIYERLGIAGARESGFPAISPELEQLLGSVGDDVVVKILRFLDPFLLDTKETISGRAIHRLLGYTNYRDFARVMFVGRNGVPAVIPGGYYRLVEMENGGGARGFKPTDHLLMPKGFRMASSSTNSLLGHTVRVWAFDVAEAFARLATTRQEEAAEALRTTLAAAEARATAAAAAAQDAHAAREAAEAVQNEALASLAAALARVKLDPLCLSSHMPATANGNYLDNKDFKRLTRAFAYLCVDALYALGVRCANTFTAMIMATTGVFVLFPTAEVSNIVATTGLQRGMKERIRIWTGVEPSYSTDMTTAQLYTFTVNYSRWYMGYCKGQLVQSTLDNSTVLPAENDVPVELAVWLDSMHDGFPDMRPIELGKTVSLDTPLADRGVQLKGQSVLDVFVQRGRLGRRRKVARLAKAEGPVEVCVVEDSESE